MAAVTIVISGDERKETDIRELLKELITELDETCDTQNQLLQNLSDAWENVRETAERLAEFLRGWLTSKEYLRILLTQEDTARQEQGREAVTSKYVVKWWEKYRPP